MTHAGQPYFCKANSSATVGCSFNGLTRGFCSVSDFAASGMISAPLASGVVGNYSVVESTCTSPYYTNSGTSESPFHNPPGEYLSSSLQPQVGLHVMIICLQLSLDSIYHSFNLSFLPSPCFRRFRGCHGDHGIWVVHQWGLPVFSCGPASVLDVSIAKWPDSQSGEFREYEVNTLSLHPLTRPLLHGCVPSPSMTGHRLSHK